MTRLQVMAQALLLLISLLVGSAFAAESSTHSAEVTVDGHVLLQVRGVAAVPAASRARNIANNLIDVADNPAIDPDDVALVTRDDGGIELRFGGERTTFFLI